MKITPEEELKVMKERITRTGWMEDGREMVSTVVDGEKLATVLLELSNKIDSLIQGK